MAIFTARLERAVVRVLQGRGPAPPKDGPAAQAAAHGVTVALILSRYSDDEDVLIAGLLLDALQDPTAAEALEREFGARVVGMIRDVAEPLRELPWGTRTARYLRRLSSTPNPSLLVASADVIATLIALIGAREAPGGEGGLRFGGPIEEQLRLGRGVYEAVRGSWPRCPLLPELRKRLEEAERKLLRHP